MFEQTGSEILRYEQVVSKILRTLRCETAFGDLRKIYAQIKKETERYRSGTFVCWIVQNVQTVTKGCPMQSLSTSTEFFFHSYRRQSDGRFSNNGADKGRQPLARMHKIQPLQKGIFAPKDNREYLVTLQLLAMGERVRRQCFPIK